MKAIGTMSKRELRNEVASLRHNISTSAGLKCPKARCHDRGEYKSATGFITVMCGFCHEIPDSIFMRNQDPTPYCHACGAMEQKECGCGPYAENH